ncbi:hypothetical protein LGM45_21210 [Burkholderia cepacia]|uniref:hypothetical protein n=1 Tax=Burkholderia cepacia TaxID=292 RepID=UPI001CF5301F|nr:hypothetical protein [Burkholderia cepacia]MCA7931568.1 hypothetical protein [Burkholderia cepacia]
MEKEAGYTSAQGAIMGGFVNWSGAPGSVASGWLMDRLDRYRVSDASFAWRHGRSGPGRCSPLLGDRSFPARIPV